METINGWNVIFEPFLAEKGEDKLTIYQKQIINDISLTLPGNDQINLSGLSEWRLRYNDEYDVEISRTLNGIIEKAKIFMSKR